MTQHARRRSTSHLRTRPRRRARVGEIGRGLLVFAGVEKGDGAEDIAYVAGKVNDLRIFEDAAGKMNLSIGEAGGAVLVVSQFTLCGDCRRGRRPSFDDAESPAAAKAMYEGLIDALRALNVRVETGEFQAAHGSGADQRRPCDDASGQPAPLVTRG